MGANLKVKEQEGFYRKQVHDLSKLLREMNKESLEALEHLTKLFKSQDDKVKLEALRLFFTTYKDVAKDINQDQFQRLLANHKFRGPGQLSTDDEDDIPMVDFNRIQDV